MTGYNSITSSATWAIGYTLPMACAGDATCPVYMTRTGDLEGAGLERMGTARPKSRFGLIKSGVTSLDQMQSGLLR